MSEDSPPTPASSAHQPSPKLPPSGAPQRFASEAWVIGTIWFSYGAFYFCRTNISAAVPGLTAPLAEGGMGLTQIQMGWILASLKIAYAGGQLVNGQLSERFSPRLLLAIGMFCSAALNVLFGFGAGTFFLLFVWACNGYFQSLGWTPCVRVLSNWTPPHRRGLAMGVVGTGYQITLGLTYVLATAAAAAFGWRGALFAPAAVLATAGVFMLILLRESPEASPDASPDTAPEQMENTPAQPAAAVNSVAENIAITVTNPALWLLGISLGLLNACRYGFLDWGIKYLIDVQGSGISKAGIKFCVIAIGAAAGSFLTGWATDRFFGGRRAPVICVLLVLLGLLTFVFESASRSSVAGTMGLLVLIGFCIYGPQVLLVGTAPSDLARKNTAAAAAGFVNFMGYLGAASGDVITGACLDAWGWQATLYVWASWAFAAAIFAGLLWNATSKEET